MLYNFFIQNDTDLFSEKDAFDNKHGIMAYNRTDQEKGRATKYLPASEWIVSVGKHPGLVLGKVWVQIQESLNAINQNLSESHAERSAFDRLYSVAAVSVCIRK